MVKITAAPLPKAALLRRFQSYGPKSLGYLGLLIFGVSLALPAVRHGEVVYGIFCFAISILLVCADASCGGTAAEMVWMCRIGWLANLGAVGAFALGNYCQTAWRFGALPILVLVAIAVFYLIVCPYSQLQSIYPGYYLWLLSLLMIAAAGDWGAAQACTTSDPGLKQGS